jgi:antitoxin component of MazEF toxin-antitoxin module
MKTKIRQIGNSKGILIPRSLLQDAGILETVNLVLTDDGILIQGSNRPIRRKPRDIDESEGLFRIMKAELDAAQASGALNIINMYEFEATL